MTFNSDYPPASSPIFDYSSRDYLSVYNDLLNRISVYFPSWTSQNQSDFGIVLLQMFAYCVDILSYYLDRLYGEAFMDTATQAASILNIAQMLDYQPQLAIGATVNLLITLASTTPGPVTIPVGTQFQTPPSLASSAPIIFETTEAVIIPALSAATPQFQATAPAVQGVTITDEAVATSDGTINQSYPLLNNPAAGNSFSQLGAPVSGAPVEAPTQLYVDVGLGPQLWTFVTNLINYGPFSQVYTSFVDANGVFYIVFGDGVNGYVPPLGSPVTCNYVVTDGSAGNVGANSITQNVTAIVGFQSVTNPQAASGGTDPESLTQIAAKAPASLQALNRAITPADIATLAEQVPGVQWASVIELTYQLVWLYISPTSGGNPSASLLSSVSTTLQPLVLANTTVTLKNPTYVDINVSASVVVGASYGNTATQQAIISALEALLMFSSTGFGFRVTLAQVYNTILAIAGVQYLTITALNRAMLALLTANFAQSSSYSSLPITALPQAVAAGDILLLTNSAGATQSVTAAAPGAAAGALSIPVNTFTANANYAIGSNVQDTTFVGDCVLLESEIPVAGSLNITVTGGPAGS